jgi:hypothetical protein
VHVEESLLGEHGEIDLEKTQGIANADSAVREKTTYNFNLDELRNQVIAQKQWK